MSLAHGLIRRITVLERFKIPENFIWGLGTSFKTLLLVFRSFDRSCASFLCFTKNSFSFVESSFKVCRAYLFGHLDHQKSRQLTTVVCWIPRWIVELISDDNVYYMFASFLHSRCSWHINVTISSVIKIGSWLSK